jgi:tetratricopeptide (TPR) repeat protein
MNTDLETKEVATVRRPHWAILVAAAVFIPLVILGGIDLSLRIAGVGYSTDLLVPCTVRGTPASCYNLFFAAPFFPAGMVQTPRLYSIPATKPPGTVRIFILGESAAMGDPDSAYGFSRYLEVMLRARYPSTRFEIVNTGSVAINSHVELPIAKGLADQQPDIFISYSGNNEVVGPYGAGTMLTSSAMSMPVVRASMWYHSTRIGQSVTRLGTQKREWRGMEMFLDKQVPASSPQLKYVYANFEQNLRDTIAIARKAGAKFIVATVATNLKDCAPFASQHRDGLKAEDLRSWTALVEQGNQLEATNASSEALKLYRAAAKIDDEYAELEFRIARSLAATGDNKAAKEHFARARDLDTLRFRADSRINEINRAVASSAPDVALVDADKVLSDASPDGIIGSDLVYEHVHLTPEGNYLLARAMFVQIAKDLHLDAAQSPDSGILSEADCEQLLALTRYDRYRLAADMLNRLQKAPFTTQLNHSEQIFRIAAKAQRPDETPDDTVAQYQWAITRSPEDTMLRLRFGMFLYPYNRAASAEQVGMAQPWDGYPVFLPDGTQVR